VRRKRTDAMTPSLFRFGVIRLFPFGLRGENPGNIL
jgi:hypothetical protein